LKAGNGEIMAQGELLACNQACESQRQRAGGKPDRVGEVKESSDF
jgi:hypothetical protein